MAELSENFSDNLKVIDVKKFSKATFYVEKEGEVEIQVELSYDKVSLFFVCLKNIDADKNKERFVMDVNDHFMRVSVRGKGKVNIILILS